MEYERQKWDFRRSRLHILSGKFLTLAKLRGGTIKCYVAFSQFSAAKSPGEVAVVCINEALLSHASAANCALGAFVELTHVRTVVRAGVARESLQDWCCLGVLHRIFPATKDLFDATVIVPPLAPAD